MRLSGWKRLGIALTATWLIGAPAIFLWMAQRDNDQYVNSSLLACLDAKMPTGYCVESSALLRSLVTKTAPDLRTLGPVVLVPVPFAWLAGWILIGVGRWIERGFAGDRGREALLRATRRLPQQGEPGL